MSWETATVCWAAVFMLPWSIYCYSLILAENRRMKYGLLKYDNREIRIESGEEQKDD